VGAARGGWRRQGWQAAPLNSQPPGTVLLPCAEIGTISEAPGARVSPPDTALRASVPPVNCQFANGSQAPG